MSEFSTRGKVLCRGCLEFLRIVRDELLLTSRDNNKDKEVTLKSKQWPNKISKRTAMKIAAARRVIKSLAIKKGERKQFGIYCVKCISNERDVNKSMNAEHRSLW